MILAEVGPWLKAGHITVFAVWLGTDLATFTISGRVVDPALGVPARVALARVMLQIEVLARLCLPTMLGLGLLLYLHGYRPDEPAVASILIAVLTVAWVAMVLTVHRSSTGELASGLARFDLAVRTLVTAGLWVTGLWSVTVDGGPFAPHWIAVKVVLFAVIMTCGIAIRFALRPFAGAFAALAADGPTPEREGAVTAALARARPLVVVIWLCLVSSVVLATGALPLEWLNR